MKYHDSPITKCRLVKIWKGFALQKLVLTFGPACPIYYSYWGIYKILKPPSFEDYNFLSPQLLYFWEDNFLFLALLQPYSSACTRDSKPSGHGRKRWRPRSGLGLMPPLHWDPMRAPLRVSFGRWDRSVPLRLLRILQLLQRSQPACSKSLTKNLGSVLLQIEIRNKLVLCYMFGQRFVAERD